MYSKVRREANSETNEMAFHTPINFSKELKQVLYERNLLTAQTRKKLGSMLDSSGSPMGRSPNSEMDKRRNFRLQAIEEIVNSEKTYLKQLETLMQYFVLPLKEQAIIDDASHTMLFGQIEMIYNLNGELLRELENNLDNVSQAFLKMAPFLKLYSVYAFDYRSSLLTIQQQTSQNPAFRKFLEHNESRPEVQRKLNSLMITPIQRVPRYKLLLEQVLLYTSPADADFKLLKESVKQIEYTVSHINSCIEDQEITQLLINLQNSLLNRAPSIVKPSRKVIKEGTLHKIARNGSEIKRYCILMSDIFMYCKILKERSPNTVVENSLECCCIFPLKKCKVYEMLPGNFKITCQGGDGLIFCTKDLQLGCAWVAFIRNAIDLHIQCRKTLRKESSKRKPLRKNDIKNFELDYVLSPNKRKCDYETIFRSKNHCSDSEDEDKAIDSNSYCFPRSQHTTAKSSPYMPSSKMGNTTNIPSSVNRKRCAAIQQQPLQQNTINNGTTLRDGNIAETSTKRISSRLYKYIAAKKMCTPNIIKPPPMEHCNNFNTIDRDSIDGFVGGSHCSNSNSYFRANNVDTMIPSSTVTCSDFFATPTTESGNFRDVLYPLRSSGGSNKSANSTTFLTQNCSLASKENLDLPRTSPQTKRVKFNDVAERVQYNKQKPFDFSSNFIVPTTVTASSTTKATTIRDRIYAFFANLF